LTSIAGSLGLLAAGAGGRLLDGAARLISIAHTNAQRLVRLINDILDIGKMEAGSMIFEFAPIDLRATVEQTIDANRAIAEEQGVSVRLDSSSPSLSVRADADRLIQVITNLLSNAIKFSPRDSEVVVTIVKGPLSGRVMVRDHGVGIPKEFKSRIFGKFEQAKADGVQKKVGSGLGLNIVAKIVTQHAGTFGFDDSPGGGTIFHFDIPLWNADSARKTALPRHALSP
jgi:signal transduction histidine kinase